jgi:hypothetical protein
LAERVAAINARTDAWGAEIGAGDFTGLNIGTNAVSASLSSRPGIRK